MRSWPVLASLVLAAVDCGSSQPAPAASAASASTPPEAPSSPAIRLPPGLSTPLVEALHRVHALLDKPDDDAAIQAAFSPDFLSAIPPEKLKSVLTESKAFAGACRSDAVVSTRGEARAVVRLTCERGAIDATIAVDRAPPYRMVGLLLRPASP